MHRQRGLGRALLALLFLVAQSARSRAGQLNPLAGTPPPHKMQRIVGGTAADIKDFGHQISWFYEGYHRCGGSILAPEWVLTASHCCVGASPGPTQEIYAGTSVITLKGRHHGQWAQVIEIHMHPHFDQRVYSNDIALLRVLPAFTFDNVVRPIPIIDTSGMPYTGETVTVTGWGLVKENSNFQTPILQKVKVFVTDTQACRVKYLGESWALPDTIMCAAAEKKDACQGDSGGPLIYSHPEDGKDRLVGLVSSGIGCANKDYPGLYTDLRHHDMREFINEVTGLKLAN